LRGIDPDDPAPDFSEGKSCKACEWRAAAAKSAAEAARARDTLLQAGFFLEALGATGFCLECPSSPRLGIRMRPTSHTPPHLMEVISYINRNIMCQFLAFWKQNARFDGILPAACRQGQPDITIGWYTTHPNAASHMWSGRCSHTKCNNFPV
jgi:hypothetical protein